METQKVESPSVINKKTTEAPVAKSGEKKKKNKNLRSLFGDSTQFSKFDPITGEKTATKKDDSNRALANMEMSADARKNRSSPMSVEETLKDAATGGSLSFLSASSILKSNKAKALVGLAGAVGTGVMSAKKQLSNYNKQQGARESIAGKKTSRSKAYSDMISKKYDTK